MIESNVWTVSVETQWELVGDPGWEEGPVKPVAKRKSEGAADENLSTGQPLLIMVLSVLEQRKPRSQAWGKPNRAKPLSTE